MARNIGLCLGSVTLGIASSEGIWRERHAGQIKDALDRTVTNLKITPNDHVVVTGRSRNVEHPFLTITEPEAIEAALATTDNPPPNAVISFGGQTIVLYEIDKRNCIARPHSFGKCGSGTGEFLLQQFGRLGYASVEEAVAAGMQDEAFSNPYIPAARCSVFCKSDTTHALNEQKATKPQIVAGLFKMLAEKLEELAERIKARDLWVVGGGAVFTPMINYLKADGYNVVIPPYAEVFEAWGASHIAKNTLFARKSVVGEKPKSSVSFSRLPALSECRNKLRTCALPRAEATKDEKCILSIDVGSTSTKMVLCRENDLSILGSYYGYTLGQPQTAVVKGFSSLLKDLRVPVEIIGVSVTGSGRNITDAFLTDYGLLNEDGSVRQQVMVIDEISCHAKAAAHFNPGVSCILEIGGQDAKYTVLSEGVPVDFCMNEACSAGTGSFLEECAREMFNISDPREIAPRALKATSPIQFGDQCSAFIESDVHAALAEGANADDVIAGLNYSICWNYLNRVVGNRPIKGNISLQGGTAYNEAFCLAMIAVLNLRGFIGPEDHITVSKDSGLMGAIGGAIHVRNALSTGSYKPIQTTLIELSEKKLETAGKFICPACDYKCSIQLFRSPEGNKIPFGGFCRRYDNVRKKKKHENADLLDMAAKRDELLFAHSNLGERLPDNAKSIGILGNLFELTYLPFTTELFAALGFKTTMADKADPDGVKREGASFCWPIERSHALTHNLIKKKPDYIWLPHVITMGKDTTVGQCCPLVQGNPFILRSAFPEIKEHQLLTPSLRLNETIESINEQLASVGILINRSSIEVGRALGSAIERQSAFRNACKSEGRKILDWLAEDRRRFSYVLVGRPYNAFSNHLESNKGIARKIASMEIGAVPLDLLPFEGESEPDEYWSSGQSILQGARYVAKHPQLYAVFLTNFSCGPDSFIVTRLAHHLKGRPFLILEFDGHTANAGFDTRIEAFTNIVKERHMMALRDEDLAGRRPRNE